MEIEVGDILLCEFYFSDSKSSKKRPVLVLKDNLPYKDFVGLPLSSKTANLHDDELLLDNDNLQSGILPVQSKIMVRKAFVISRSNPVKRYGKLSNDYFDKVKVHFCTYFGCLR